MIHLLLRTPLLAEKKDVTADAPQSGYTDCACRDCFDVAVSNDMTRPDLCGDCEEAGCVPRDGDCSRSIVATLLLLVTFALSGCLSFDPQDLVPIRGVSIQHAGWDDGGYERAEWLRREERRFYNPPSYR